jgi:hypothetical protein
MGYQRITAELRDGVVVNALNQRFSNERLGISQQEERVRQLTVERDKVGYEAAFSDIDRQRLKAAPDGWFPTDTRVKVAVEETNEVIEIAFDTPRRVPFEVHEGRYGTLIASIIKPDHPYIAARNAVRDAKAILEAMQQELKESERALRARVKAVVESVSSVARLVEVWPEAQELLPEVHAGTGGGLPAQLIADLNAELGLKTKAA